MQTRPSFERLCHGYPKRLIRRTISKNQLCTYPKHVVDFQMRIKLGVSVVSGNSYSKRVTNVLFGGGTPAYSTIKLDEPESGTFSLGGEG